MGLAEEYGCALANVRVRELTVKEIDENLLGGMEKLLSGVGSAVEQDAFLQRLGEEHPGSLPDFEETIKDVFSNINIGGTDTGNQQRKWTETERGRLLGEIQKHVETAEEIKEVAKQKYENIIQKISKVITGEDKEHKMDDFKERASEYLGIKNLADAYACRK